MPVIDNIKLVKSALENRLIGAEIDSIRVYGVELQINFLLQGKDGFESYWVSSTGAVCVACSGVLYCQRCDVVGSLCEVVGSRVSAVDIEADGRMSLSCDGRLISIAKDESGFEIAWAFTPDSPSPYEEHRWSLVLTEDSELVLSGEGFL